MALGDFSGWNEVEIGGVPLLITEHQTMSGHAVVIAADDHRPLGIYAPDGAVTFPSRDRATLVWQVSRAIVSDGLWYDERSIQC